MAIPCPLLPRLAGLAALGWYILIAAHGGAAAEPLPLRVQLLWHHQAQFAGIYVAEAKGFYERARVEVELVEGSPGLNPADELGYGRVDAALAWLPAAMNTRWGGRDIVNIGQVFRESGTAIVCRRDAGIRSVEDIAGKTIGVWYIGDEINLRFWLDSVGISATDVTLRAQFRNARDLISGRVDCATAMMYNEYWSILDSHLSPSDIMVFRLSEEGLGLLEDGIYARRDSLEDPERREALARFLWATMQGWAYAADNLDEAFAITMAMTPGAVAEHQQRMLHTVLRLLGPTESLGLLDIGSFNRSIDMIGSHQGPEMAGRLAEGAWTQRIWYEAALGEDSLLRLTSATRHHLSQTISTHWFIALNLMGAVVFGFAGFMRAQQRRYDLWGAFVLTLLPAAGGGTIRDLLVGGERYPPFIVQDPVYIYVVGATFLAGIVATAFLTKQMIASRSFDWTMKFFDTLGFATFAVIGAKVAIMAELTWIWVPICCALTCAGGGMLSDIIMGREPRTFQGEPYEELAIIGGLFMLAGLQIADAYEHEPWIGPTVIVATLVLVFLMRGSVIVFNIRFLPLSGREDGPAPPEPGPAAAQTPEQSVLAGPSLAAISSSSPEPTRRSGRSGG